MITNILVDQPWMAPAALVLLVVLGPIVGSRLVSRARLAWALFGVSLLPVFAFTFVPVDRQLYGRCVASWSLPTPGRVELMANVVLFVAPALLFVVASRRPLLTVIAGSALSAAIEAVQAAATSIGRSCDTNDWLSNTIGVAIGAMLGVVAIRTSTVGRRSATP